jgi:YggT family protein
MQSLINLIEVIFNLYLMVVLLRIWLQLVRADFYNPFSQFVVKATNPAVVPLRRIIPGIAGVDWAAVFLALVVSFAKWAILMQFGSGFSLIAALILALLSTLKEAGMLLFWVLLLRAILSWVSQGRSPIEYVLSQLTEPLLAPIRRVIPPIGGLDLSVLVLSLALIFVNNLASELSPLWSSL